MLIMQRAHDTRALTAPFFDLVAQLKKQQTPVWLVAEKDGLDSFQKKQTQDFMFLTEILFMQQTLLQPLPQP